MADGPLGLDALGSLGRIDRPDLKDPPFVPGLPADWPRDGSNVLDIIGRRDVLLHHPFHSFAPVVDFVRAGLDPNVRAIKQTLYRVGVELADRRCAARIARRRYAGRGDGGGQGARR